MPPIPADTFVLFGAFLAAAGRTEPGIIFAVTWFCNVASSVGVYALAHRYGQAFFITAVGRHLLHPRQIQQIGVFYHRWGTPAIFVSRFLPGLRALVPVFAGIARLPARHTVPPIAVASGLWYGFLVHIGALAGNNWPTVVALFGLVSRALFWVALPLLVLLALWWWKTRRHKG